MEVNLQNFKLLHNYLVSILSTNNYQSQHLPEKIMQYIGMIVQSQKNPSLNEDLFDFFCENNGNKIIKLTLQVDPMLSVKVLSMLFINLSSQHWISYLLCQPFIVDAIQYEDVPHQQQWPEFYISLLKSMSIRLNEEQLSLFYNKKFCKFPLIYEALKYYNHPDCMVRTNVMNIILGIMKIKDERLAKYFGRLPFTSYVLTYCCQVKARIESLNQHLLSISSMTKEQYKIIEEKHQSIIKSYFIDLIDYICYLNDIMELGPSQLSFFVQNCILTYIILPTLSLIDQKKSNLLVCSSLFLIFTIYKNITNEKFKQTLCVMLMGQKLPRCMIEQLSRKKQQMVYTPKVYSEQFQPNKYYWKNFDYQIERQCVKIFEDIKDFQTEHEGKQQNIEQTKQFMEEVGKISDCLGFNILNYEGIEGKVALTEIIHILGFSDIKQNQLIVKSNVKQSQIEMIDNPIRQQMLKILNNSLKDYRQDSTIMCITTVINSLTTSEVLRNKVLQYCGLLLPRLDTINYKNQYNLISLDKFKVLGLQFINKINEGFVNNISIKQKQLKMQQSETSKIKQQCVQVDLQLFGLMSIKNLGILFFESLHERLKQQQEMLIVELYRRSIIEMKELIAKKNMKIIVQNFQVQYIRWNKQSFFHSTNLTQSILTPRKSAEQLKSESQAQEQSDSTVLNKLYFKDKKQKILYYIQKFIFVQTFFIRYYETYVAKLPPQMKQQDEEYEEIKGFYFQKYVSIYHQKFCKIEDKWKIGYYYQIQFRHMVECFTQQKKTKNTKRLIIVQDPNNFVVVEPSNQQNKAKIIANHPWKYVFCQIDRQTGRKMVMKLYHCHRGDNRITVFFEDQLRSAGTLQWMNNIKYQRYQSEQAFIFSYIKDCLMRIERLKNKQ